MLLVLGAAMLAGGVRYSEQHFNPVGARSEATMLTLAAIALIVPAAFEAAADMTAEGLGRLSVSLSVVLLFTYVLFLTFRSSPIPRCSQAPPPRKRKRTRRWAGRCLFLPWPR